MLTKTQPRPFLDTPVCLGCVGDSNTTSPVPAAASGSPGSGSPCSNLANLKIGTGVWWALGGGIAIGFVIGRISKRKKSGK